MRILIADDDAIARRTLEAYLSRWGYEVIVARDGEEAWDAIERDDAPNLAIFDWMMPKLDGVELVRRLRARSEAAPVYVILLTSRKDVKARVTGLESGADDYVVKPFDAAELKARVEVGSRVIALQSALARRVDELEEALGRVRQLQALLPICMYCKRVRDDGDYWHQLERYIEHHADTRFSHGICPSCYDSVVVPMLDAYRHPEP